VGKASIVQKSAIAFVTPERLAVDTDLVQQLTSSNRLGRIVLDEAHCVTQWGHAFRHAYLKCVAAFGQHCPPITALTATATAARIWDIRLSLGMHHDTVVLKPPCFDRPNIRYEVRQRCQKDADVASQVAAILKNEFLGAAGIVYCATTRLCDVIADRLLSEGIAAAAYYASIDAPSKASRFRRWKTEVINVIVATTAFGMGINKSDVRFVVHADMSDSLEAYQQESGRAGRDGSIASAIALWRPLDQHRLTRVHQLNSPDQQQQLLAVQNYCESGICRRSQLLAVLDEKVIACSGCDICWAAHKPDCKLASCIGVSSPLLPLIHWITVWSSNTDGLGFAEIDDADFTAIDLRQFQAQSVQRRSRFSARPRGVKRGPEQQQQQQPDQDPKRQHIDEGLPMPSPIDQGRPTLLPMLPVSLSDSDEEMLDPDEILNDNPNIEFSRHQSRIIEDLKTKSDEYHAICPNDRPLLSVMDIAGAVEYSGRLFFFVGINRQTTLGATTMKSKLQPNLFYFFQRHGSQDLQRQLAITRKTDFSALVSQNDKVKLVLQAIESVPSQGARMLAPPVVRIISDHIQATRPEDQQSTKLVFRHVVFVTDCQPH
jgi:hypothetical protein